jgi:hypothetical protein
MHTRTIVVAMALASSLMACASADDGASFDEGALNEGSPKLAADGALNQTESSAADVAPRVDRVGAPSAIKVDAVVRLRDRDSDLGEVTVARARFSAEALESGRELADWMEVVK